MSEQRSQSEPVEMIGLPVHPLKAWGEQHRRKTTDDVCTKCGDDMRMAGGEYVCPACLTRGNPDRYQRRHYMPIEELVNGGED